MKFVSKPMPMQGESLSGYIQRVAAKNFITPGQIWQNFGFNKYVYHQSAISRYLDINPYQSLNVSRFAEMLDLGINSIEQLTFLPVLKKFDFIDTEYLYKSFRTKRHYCPECLKEDNSYKLIFQIKGINFCEKHNTDLISTCWNCKKPINLLGRHSETGDCNCCGASLKDANAISYVSSDKERIIFELWQFLLDLSDITKYRVNDLCFKNSLAVKLLFLLKNYDSSALKRKLFMYVKNDFNHDHFGIDINFIIKTLLQTNTNFVRILNENIPDYFLQNIQAIDNKFLNSYRNIINLFI